MKKLLLGAFLGIFTFAWVAVLPNSTIADVDEFNVGSREAQNDDYNPTVAGSNDGLQNDSLITTIKTAINWVLWMLSFIALLLCLWWGFKMMTSGGDQKKYQDGLNILKWAAIGLAVIALAWLIVSLIFWVINGSINKS